MKKVEIPKKSGGTRTIYVQDPRSKNKYRLAGWECAQLAAAKPTAHVIHGFAEMRSPVTNAMAHRGFMFTLNMDLADFFDTVGEAHLVNAGASVELAKRCVYDGACRQGLSSSPAAANLAATGMDAAILGLLTPGMVYTRYADDLSVSGNDKDTVLWIRAEIPPIAERYGFKVNPKKTRFQDARFGRRCVTGIMVDQDIHVPRSTRRALRAAMHGYPGSNKTRGLEEWCKLKPPRPGGSGKSGVYAATAAAHKAKAAFNTP